MYGKSDRLCPRCFRVLLEDKQRKNLYCPDVLKCEFKVPMLTPPRRATVDILQHALGRAMQAPISVDNHQKVERIKLELRRLQR